MRKQGCGPICRIHTGEAVALRLGDTTSDDGKGPADA